MPSSLLLSAAFAGVVAVGATVAVERLGGRLGGVLASIPTTIVPASLGMWAGAAEPAAFTAAMGAVPAGMLVDAGFLWTWRVLPPRLPAAWSLPTRLVAMSAASLGLWLAGAVAFVVAMGRLDGGPVPPWTVGAAALVVQVGVGVWACRTGPAAPRGSRRVAPLVLAGRGLLAAAAIGAAVAIADSGAPLAGGVASVFPAIFLTTMVSLWLAQGEAVPVGAVGPIMLGSASVGVYALAAIALFPALGPALGAAVGWGVAVVGTSVPAAAWLRRVREAP